VAIAATLDFSTGNTTASVVVPYPSLTVDTVIQLQAGNKLEEVAVLDLRFAVSSRTNGVGFTVLGVSMARPHGQYLVNCIIS
jgi:hypothetical protein